MRIFHKTRLYQLCTLQLHDYLLSLTAFFLAICQEVRSGTITSTYFLSFETVMSDLLCKVVSPKYFTAFLFCRTIVLLASQYDFQPLRDVSLVLLALSKELTIVIQ